MTQKRSAVEAFLEIVSTKPDKCTKCGTKMVEVDIDPVDRTVIYECPVRIDGNGHSLKMLVEPYE